MKRITTLIVALLLALAVAVPAAAHGRGATHGLACGKTTHGIIADSAYEGHSRAFGSTWLGHYQVYQYHYAFGSSGVVYTHTVSKYCLDL